MRGERKIALFFTGQEHAGENIAKVLAKRAKELPLPIQMSDALSRNTSGEFETLVSNCNAHARRNFVDVYDNFPAEVRPMLDAWSQVYHVDADTKRDKLSPEERLRLHQERSLPAMTELKAYCEALLIERKAEPSSGLGVRRSD